MSEQQLVGSYFEAVHLCQEFRIYYQPIVSLETFRITGFEALVSWQSPDHGFISSAELIPVAEEMGLIVPIDWWVLGEACRQVRAWQAKFPINPPLTISVNLSSRQFLRPHLLLQQIDQTLQQTGLDAHSLNLDIPINLLAKNIVAATATLSELKALGVQLHIDNFGTGYSSLGYLHRFPLNTLKIDRAFVSEMDTDGEHLQIVKTCIKLADNLSLDVIANGVETAEQLAQLKMLKCKYGQGYFFCEPVDAKRVEALMMADIEGELCLNPHVRAFDNLTQAAPDVESEPKNLRVVSLTNTAWNALAEIGKRQNKSRAQLLEEWALTGSPATTKEVESDDAHNIQTVNTGVDFAPV